MKDELNELMLGPRPAYTTEEQILQKIDIVRMAWQSKIMRNNFKFLAALDEIKIQILKWEQSNV